MNNSSCFTRWRFYTEHVNTTFIREEVAKTFPDGANITYGHGVWEGGEESTLVIEVITETLSLFEAEQFAERIRKKNNQEAVLISWDSVFTMLVTENTNES